MSAPVCPDCAVPVAEKHQSGCDVARCLHCGGQWISCGHTLGSGDVWTGEWPGVADCRRLGWYAYFRPEFGEGDGFQQCGPDHPGASEDLNRLAWEGVWDREMKRFEAPR